MKRNRLRDHHDHPQRDRLRVRSFSNGNISTPQEKALPPSYLFDLPLMMGFLLLLGLGLTMVTSSSLEFAEFRFGNSMYFIYRHCIYMVLALLAATVVYLLPLSFWQRSAAVWLVLALILLSLVLMPGISREINGSKRWLEFAGMSLQPSELLKFALIVYVAGFLTRHHQSVRGHYLFLLLPLLLVGLMLGLVLLQPDLGTVVVLGAALMLMLFLGGIKVLAFIFLGLVSLAAALWLINASPYRLERIYAFLDPWADPLGNGYQLSHSLIAFGRGEWFGTGLGNGIQKQFYLPEVHTDFIFAVIAEELGLIGVVLVIALFAWIWLRLLSQAGRAERAGICFNAYVLYGVAILLGIQSFINMGVSMGLLPTKGLTLPFISYGGSSLLVSCILAGLALRAIYELNVYLRDGPGVDDSIDRDI